MALPYKIVWFASDDRTARRARFAEFAQSEIFGNQSGIGHGM
jgi:hypothetical protein